MVKNDLRSEQDQRKQAIVIGAGIAGLLAARVLSEHYGRVLIVERDVFPSHFEVRAGTPQAFHVHRILPRGKMILEHLFPGYTQELLAEGAYENRIAHAAEAHSNGRYASVCKCSHVLSF